MLERDRKRVTPVQISQVGKDQFFSFEELGIWLVQRAFHREMQTLPIAHGAVFAKLHQIVRAFKLRMVATGQFVTA